MVHVHVALSYTLDIRTQKDNAIEMAKDNLDDHREGYSIEMAKDNLDDHREGYSSLLDTNTHAVVISHEDHLRTRSPCLQASLLAIYASLLSPTSKTIHVRIRTVILHMCMSSITR